MSVIECVDFPEFVSIVAKRCAIAVDRLPDVETPPQLMGSLERREYRSAKEDKIDATVDRIKSRSKEQALIESDINMVRLSVKMAYEGPDACTLTRKVQEKFFVRLSRGDLHLRKKPLDGFDLTFIFTSQAVGSDVESLLRSALPVLRQLSKYIRLNQIIENRRAGVNLFSRLVQVVPANKLVKNVPVVENVKLIEDQNVGTDDVCSMATEPGSDPDLNVDALEAAQSQVFLI